jgi:hypothetical protein
MSMIAPANSLSELKTIARTHLPANSTLKEFLLAEPEHMPLGEAREKAGMYARLIAKELGV